MDDFLVMFFLWVFSSIDFVGMPECFVAAEQEFPVCQTFASITWLMWWVLSGPKTVHELLDAIITIVFGRCGLTLKLCFQCTAVL